MMRISPENLKTLNELVGTLLEDNSACAAIEYFKDLVDKKLNIQKEVERAESFKKLIAEAVDIYLYERFPAEDRERYGLTGEYCEAIARKVYDTVRIGVSSRIPWDE